MQQKKCTWTKEKVYKLYLYIHIYISIVYIFILTSMCMILSEKIKISSRVSIANEAETMCRVCYTFP